MVETFKVSHVNNKVLHHTVGAIVEKEGKYLLIDRKNPPYGWACLAGHVDEGEEPEKAMKREVNEESHLEVINLKLIGEETLDWNWCYKGATQHHWYVYQCKVKGEPVQNEEAKSIAWFTPEEIKSLSLESSWDYWLKKLKII